MKEEKISAMNAEPTSTTERLTEDEKPELNISEFPVWLKAAFGISLTDIYANQPNQAYSKPIEYFDRYLNWKQLQIQNKK